jgi:hypothetical protein
MDEEEKKFPVGVRIIAVLFCIIAVLGILFGLLLIFMSEVLGNFLNTTQILSTFGSISTVVETALSIFGPIPIIIGIIIFAFSVITLFVGIGLWKAKRGPRILTIIFGFIALIISVITIINADLTGGMIGIIGLVVSSIIPLYLLFNQRVREVFT